MWFQVILVFTILSSSFSLPALDQTWKKTEYPIDISNAPWNAAILLQLRTYRLYCDSSLINKNAVITSAVCLLGISPSNLALRVGSTYHNTGGEVINAAQVLIHPQFVFSKSENDIGIIVLLSPVSESSKVQLIPIASSDFTVADGTMAISTGWDYDETFKFAGSFRTNRLSTSALQSMNLPIINEGVCKKLYEFTMTLNNKMICAGETGAKGCYGSQGWPLVTDGILIGITSKRYGCLGDGLPGVFTKVSAYVDWIKESTDNRKA